MLFLSRLLKKEPEHSSLMLSVLKKLKSQHATLNIHFPPSNQIYSTIIFAATAKRPAITLDGFVSHHADLKMQSHQVFVATANLEGVKVTFQSQCYAKGVRRKNPFYLVEPPFYFNYEEKRRTPRIKTEAFQLQVQIKSLTGHVYNAKIIDLSQGGLRVVLPNNTTSLFQVAHRLNDAIITLENGELIDIDLEVASATYLTGAHHTELGLKFVRISHLDSELLLANFSETPIST